MRAMSSHEPGKPHSPTNWSELDVQEQLTLREAFGHYQDGLPPSCSLELKTQRFQHWLAQQGVVLDRL